MQYHFTALAAGCQGLPPFLLEFLHLCLYVPYGIISLLEDGRAICPEALPLYYTWREVMAMTNIELLGILISVTCLVLTVYFGIRR